MQVGAEALAHHALGVADAAGAVERKAGRQAVQDGAARLGGAQAGGLAAPDGGRFRQTPPVERHAGVEIGRAEAAAGIGDDDALDLHAGHAFGGVDREPDGGFGLVHVDDDAALDAARPLMADAEDAGAMGASAQHVRGLGRDQLGDQADHLGGADVEHAEDRALARRDRLHAGQTDGCAIMCALPCACVWAASRAAAASSVRRT